MRKVLIVIVIVIVGAVGWYLLSPLWRNIELNEASPLGENVVTGEQVIKDRIETMVPEEHAAFEAAVEKARENVMEKTETMPAASHLSARGDFKPRAHDVEGHALLIETGGKKILRFEDFETINGPELHIYLASTLGDEDFVDLGKIRATRGNVNYEIPEAVDTSRYSKVLVWCKPFGVLFSYAELQ